MTAFALKTVLSGSVLAAIAGLALMSHTSSASANVLHCEGKGRQSVVECCESQVRMNGLPIWMKQTGRNCAQSVQCYKNPNRCKISFAQAVEFNKQNKGGNRK